MTISPFDTIAAVSTPFGKGGVAVIRLSGEEALTAAGRVFFPVSGKSLIDMIIRIHILNRTFWLAVIKSFQVFDAGFPWVFQSFSSIRKARAIISFYHD